jgi:ribosomal protein S11
LKKLNLKRRKNKMSEELQKIEEKTQAEEFEEISEEVKEEKKPSKERVGILYINTTKNNTIMALTDAAGHTLSKASGGQSTKQSRLKSSPTIAMLASKKIAEDAKEHGITSLYLRVRGETGGLSAGSAAHAVIKSLSREDLKVISILDLTKSPRGGPKKAGGRRGRRV